MYDEPKFEIHLRKEKDSFSTDPKWVAYDKNPDTYEGHGFCRETGDTQAEAVMKLLKTAGRLYILEWKQAD